MPFGPEYLALPRSDSPWLIRSLIPRQGFVLMHAPPKQGKSTAILQCAEALSNPDHHTFFGLGIHEHGTVGFLQLDTPPDLWRSEYVELMAGVGFPFERVDFQDRDTLPKNLFPFNILNTAHEGWLRAWVNELKPVAVIVDSFRAAFIGEEDKAHVSVPVIHAFQRSLGTAALILIHHNKKPAHGAIASDESRVEEVRGSTALTGMADTIWRVGRKRWNITGRGGDARIDVLFDPETHLLTPKVAITADLVAMLRKDPKFTSERAIARHMAELSGLPFESCRTFIKRLGS